MEKLKVRLVGENGNIFNLLGIASRALKDAGLDGQAKEMKDRVLSEARSYDEALRIIMVYVEVE
ncbi:hypothetical protein [Paenibacillus sp. EPM92]|uniref:hypothetical protein n=1 Tax=Paenibacillus sp. EPM92 TaxID=1561195 RepID=UPI0019158B74|nr:hypothetical protein [Paenibacillus sp. EPM92]